MLRAMLRDLRTHRVRVAMTVAAVALGVCSVVASWVVSDSTVAMVTQGSESRDGVDVVVWDVEDPTAAIDEDPLAAIDGVEDTRLVTAFRSGLVGADGDLVGTSTPMDVSGTAWDDSGRLVLTEGSPPRDPGEIAVDATVAARSGISPGERADVLMEGGRTLHVTVVGLFDYRVLTQRDEAGEWVDPRPVVAVDPASAAETTPAAARVELDTEEGADRQAVVDTAESLGAATRVATGSALLDQDAEAHRETVWDLRLALIPFAGIALLVGTFVIANTFRLLVAQRTRQLALLRAVGARRVQVRRAVLVEAVVLALVGATLGAVLGVSIGPAILAILRSGEQLVVHVSPLAIIAGYAAAVPVTVIAAYGAARRAGRVAPMAALRTQQDRGDGNERRRTVVGGAVLAVGLVAVLATSSPTEETLSRIVGLVGTGVACVGVLMLTPVLAGAALGVASRAMRGRGGTATRLGLRNAARDPQGASSTASAVTVGLALVCAIATLSATFASLIASTTEENIPADTMLVEPSGGDETALTPGRDAPALGVGDVEEIAALPEVSVAMSSHDIMAGVSYEGGETRRVVSAVDPTGLGSALTPHMVEGTAELDQGVIMAKTQADMMGLGVGDELTLDIDGAELPTRVSGLYDATEMSASVFFDVADAPPRLADRVSRVYVTGSDPEAVRTALQDVTADRPDATVLDREALIEREIERQAAGFMIMYAMFGIAILVSVFGVVNTLVLAVRQRSREIGVMRAVGGKRRAIHRMIRVESLAVSLFGAVLGVLLGVGVGAALQNGMLGQPLWAPTIPGGVILGAFVGTVLVAVVAALWPAHIAASTDPLEAIATE